MFGSPILDVAIGLMFVYLLLSLIATAVREGVEAWLKSRAGQLDLGIRTLLHDLKGQGLARAIYEHPLIYGLYAGGYNPPSDDRTPVRRRSTLPSYIPSRNFAVALLDVIAHGPVLADAKAEPASNEPLSLDRLREAVQRMQNAPVRRALLSAIDTSQGSLARTQANIEAWYDSSMDRVAGWYKRETQKVLLLFGVGVAVVANVNTFALARHLYHDKATREVLVSRAVAADSVVGPEQSMASVRAELARLDLPIGWSNVEFSWPWDGKFENGYPWWRQMLEPLLGWAVTALAISLGAPFWFDLLNKVTVIRSTVKPREKSPEEGSEDRQPRQAPAVAAASAPVGGLAREDQAA